MKKLIFLLLITTLISCSKDGGNSSAFLSCDQLENFKDYSGEELECQFYYTLTTYNDQQYIELNSRCADLSRAYVINENCEDICENKPHDENSECGQYLNGRESIEIILIEK